jgi:hypothetical protein
MEIELHSSNTSSNYRPTAPQSKVVLYFFFIPFHKVWLFIQNKTKARRTLWKYEDHEVVYSHSLLILLRHKLQPPRNTFIVPTVFLTTNYRTNQYSKKGKAIPATGSEDPKSCEMSRLPHFLGNRLTDGGEVVSLTRRPPSTPQKDSWYLFLLEAESIPGPQYGWKG